MTSIADGSVSIQTSSKSVAPTPSWFSVGAMVLTPSIQLAALHPLANENTEVGLTDFTALHLLDFEIFPHYEQSQQAFLEQYQLGTPYPVLLDSARCEKGKEMSSLLLVFYKEHNCQGIVAELSFIRASSWIASSSRCMAFKQATALLLGGSLPQSHFPLRQLRFSA